MSHAFALALSIGFSPVRAAQFEMLPLPPLLTDGQPARAHTQGLEFVGTNLYVTARLETTVPKRPLLLRTSIAGNRWDSWDLSVKNADGTATRMDHPGGLQSDGQRLWVPVSESVRHGQTMIRAYSLAQCLPGEPLRPEVEFRVSDHIGAIAVGPEGLLGASWDTETVYVWSLDGQLQHTLMGSDLKARGLGSVSGSSAYSGLAVQDWKFWDGRLWASGLVKNREASRSSSSARLLIITELLKPEFRVRTIELPRMGQIELAQEAMGITDKFVSFIPEDLGATNRMFRAPLRELLQ